MEFLRQPIERQLTRLLGMPVTMEKLEVALFKGAATARGVTIGDDPARPLLRVEAVRLDISIGRALQKEIEVKSITIDKPEIFLLRRVDGTWNLPRRARKTTGDEPGGGDEAERGDEGQWTFDLSKLLLVEGSLRLRLELADGLAWEMEASKVLGELARAGQSLRVTLMSDVVKCAGQALPPGGLKIAAKLWPFETFLSIEACAMQASVDLGQNLRLAATSDRIAGRDFAVSLDAAVDVLELINLLPPLPALAGLRALQLRGPLRLSTELKVSGAGQRWG